MSTSDVFGADYSIVEDALYAITVCGELSVREIPRERAARLLEGWMRRGELTDPAMVEAILAHFPVHRVWLVDDAERALRATGATTRSEAAGQLRMFVYHADFTTAERDLLLNRFPVTRELGWRRTRHRIT